MEKKENTSYPQEMEALKLELSEKKRIIAGLNEEKKRLTASLGKELEDRKQDNEQLAAELTNISGNFTALLAKERENFKAALQALKEGANLKNAELKDAKDKMDELSATKQHLAALLKEKEKARENEACAAKLELAAREQLVASLGKELEDLKQDNEKLAMELAGRSGEFTAAYGKLEREAAAREKKPTKERNEVNFACEKMRQELCKTLVQKCLEMEKLTAETQDLKNRHDAIKNKLESNLSEIKEQSALVESSLCALERQEASAANPVKAKEQNKN